MTDLLKALHTEQLLSEGLLDRALKAEHELDTSLAAYKWTKVTGNHDTWPDLKEQVLLFNGRYSWVSVFEHWDGDITHWRHLGPLDTPPTGDER